MIDCWTDLSICDFELAAVCDSGPMVKYVSGLYCVSMLLMNRKLKVLLLVKLFKKLMLFVCHSQDSSSIKMIMLMKENNCEVAVSFN